MSQYPPQDPNYPYQYPGDSSEPPQPPSPSARGGRVGPSAQESSPALSRELPGGPMAPPRASKLRTITVVGIASVVIALLIVGVFVLRTLAGTTFAAQWYGLLQVSPASTSSFPASYSAELYLHLSQDSAGSLSGTGKICVNIDHSLQEVRFSVTGAAHGSSATLTLQPPASAGNPVAATASLSGDSMTFHSSDETGSTVGMLRQAGSSASSRYTSACQALPSVHRGGS